MCEQLYLMSFWICQLHGKRQRNIRCQQPLLISWIIIHISKNIYFWYSIWIFVPYCPTLWKHSHHHCLYKGKPGDLLCSTRGGGAGPFQLCRETFLCWMCVSSYKGYLAGLSSNAVQGGSSEIRLFNGNPPLKQPVIGSGWNTACKLKIEND